MTIGKQFENTFWENPETGKTHVWTRGTGTDGLPRSMPRVRNFESGEQPELEHPHQGLLFHPLTGTGMQGDPMVSEDTRRNVIKNVFSLTSTEDYKRTLGHMVRSQKVRKTDYKKDDEGNPVIESIPRTRALKQSNYRNPEGKGWPLTEDPDNPTNVLGQAFTTRTTARISDKQAQKHMDWITESTSNTDIPTHILEKRAENPLGVVLDPTPGRAYIEGFGSNIRLTYPRGGVSRTRYVDTETHEPSETPIHNPKFWDQLDKVTGDSHEHIIAEEALNSATHWVHPKTGHVLKSDAVGDFSGVAGEGGGASDTADWLREKGYVPNLFPGSANLTSKSYATKGNVKLERDYDWREGRDYSYATFHTRFKPDTEKPKKIIREKVTTRETPDLAKDTIIHEFGHALDPNLGDRKNNQFLLGTHADPIKEGIADAVADRYVRYQGQYEDTLGNNAQRVKDFEKTGYTTGYSGWKTNLHRALYVAARHHTALNTENIDTLPSRNLIAEQHMKTLNNAIGNSRQDRDKVTSDFVNTMALGHMYDKFSHVRGILRQAGLEKVAQEAHAEYLKNTSKPAKQPTLPGMEDFV